MSLFINILCYISLPFKWLFGLMFKWIEKGIVNFSARLTMILLFGYFIGSKM